MSIPRKDFELDLWKKPISILHLVQHESAGRDVQFRLMDDGRPYNVTGKTVMLEILKPDHNIVVMSCDVVDAAEGIVKATIVSQAVVLGGEAMAQIRVSDDGQLSKSFGIRVLIAESINADGIAESTTEFSALQDLIVEVQGWENKIDELDDRVSQIITTPAGTVNAEEIIDARGGETTLNGRFVREASGKADRVVFNNLVKNGNFSSGADWTFALAAGSVNGNEASFKATERFGTVRQLLADNSVNGHVYFVTAKVKASSASVLLSLYKNAGGSNLAVSYHSGNGDYQTMSLLAVADSSEKIGVRVIDYSTSGWADIFVKEIAVYDVTKSYDGQVPTIADIARDLIDQNGDLFVLNKKITRVILGSPTKVNVKSKPLFVDVQNNEVNMIAKYSATHDLRIKLAKTGANNIFNMSGMYKISNDKPITSTDKAGGTSMGDVYSSDWFAPWNIRADANGDGDFGSYNSWTGGNHNYNNKPTGRTSNVMVKVDGRTVTAFSDYANFVDIYWTNYVQASNTKKSDGSGREVLNENYHAHYDGVDLKIDCMIEWLEDCTVYSYYGLQSQYVPWAETVFYHGSANRAKNGTANSNSGSKVTEMITAFKSSDFIDMWIDPSYGLGKRDLYSGNAGAFVSGAKLYFRLIDSAKPKVNEMLSYRGGYRFYTR